MLTLYVNHILAARGIERPTQFLVKAGFTRKVTASILSGSIRNIKLDLIEKLCLVLYCEPYDILWWSPGRDNPFPDHHPMMVLKKSPQDYDWKGALKTMSLNDIQAFTSMLKQNSTSKGKQ